MDITLKQLQIFRAVVIAGSITKASRRVGLSQPSISQQLAKLEERLGTQLINRNRTGTVNLTPSGSTGSSFPTSCCASSTRRSTSTRSAMSTAASSSGWG